MEKMGHDPDMPDAALTEKGLVQAERAASVLAGRGIKQIIASPYTRALQTASIIAERLKVGVTVEPLAGERCLYSCYIGSPVRDLSAKWPHLDFSAVAENWWPDRGEPHHALMRRVAAFQEKWRKPLAGGGFVLVSHWYFLNALTDEDFSNGEVMFKPDFFGKRKSLP